MRDSLCLLSKSWRFDQHSGIGQLARACNSGDGAAVEAVWSAGFGDIRLHPWAGEAYNALIAEGVAGYGSYLKAARAGEDPAAVFKAFNGFQILCALRDGPFGVTGLNERLELALAKAGLIALDGDWYAGRPVMVVRNDHGVGLYNGDMGLCLPDESGRLKVWFEQPDGTLRALLPSRLPPRDGLRHDHPQIPGVGVCPTVLVLPDSPSPLPDPRAGLHRHHPRQGPPRSLRRSRPAGTGCAEKDRALFGIGGEVGLIKIGHELIHLTHALLLMTLQFPLLSDSRGFSCFLMAFDFMVLQPYDHK